MLSASQIVVHFDHQYLWKESINTLGFVHGFNHQVKVASENTTFDRYGQLRLLFNQIAGFFNH